MHSLLCLVGDSVELNARVRMVSVYDSPLRQGFDDRNAGAASLKRTGSNPLVGGDAPSGGRVALRRTITDVEQQRRTVSELLATEGAGHAAAEDTHPVPAGCNCVCARTLATVAAAVCWIASRVVHVPSWLYIWDASGRACGLWLRGLC